MSLALLVATFMWGCQEQASSPVGPEGLGPQFAPGGGGGKGGGKKSGGAVLADLTMTNGWSGEAVVSFKDGKKLIEFEYQGDGEFSWAANMAKTHAEGANRILDYCVPGGQDDDVSANELKLLFDQLIKGATTSPSNFFVRVDKTGLIEGIGPSDDHRASVAWPNEDGASPVRHFILRVGTFSELPDLIANVSVGGDIGDTDEPLTVTFTGGSVRLRAGRGRLADNFNLTCPNKDTIIMELVAQ